MIGSSADAVNWSQLIANVVVVSVALVGLFTALMRAIDKRLEIKLNEKIAPVQDRLDSHMDNEESDLKTLASETKRATKLTKQALKLQTVHMDADTVAFAKIEEKFDRRSDDFQQLAVIAENRLHALEQHRRADDPKGSRE